MKKLIGGSVGGFAGTLTYQLIMHSDESLDFHRAIFVGVFVGISVFIGSKFDKKKAALNIS